MNATNLANEILTIGQSGYTDREDELFHWRDIKEMHDKLINTQYVLDDNGICLSPVQEV